MFSGITNFSSSSRSAIGFRYITNPFIDTLRGFLVMEDTIFGCFLFVLYCGFFSWLFSEPTQHKSSSVDNKGAWEMNDSGEIVVRNEAGAVSTVKPIEQQLKDCLWDNIDEVTGTVMEVKKPTVEELLEGVEIEKITLRKARKIASALGIRQKVNGRDHKKAFLVAQIAKKLRANPEIVAPIIVDRVRAA